MKKCSKCGESKDRSAFGIDRSRPDGKNYWCKACVREAARRQRRRNRESFKGAPCVGVKKCVKCKQALHVLAFAADPWRGDGLRSACRECTASYKQLRRGNFGASEHLVFDWRWPG